MLHSGEVGGSSRPVRQAEGDLYNRGDTVTGTHICIAYDHPRLALPSAHSTETNR